MVLMQVLAGVALSEVIDDAHDPHSSDDKAAGSRAKAGRRRRRRRKKTESKSLTYQPTVGPGGVNISSVGHLLDTS